MNAEKFLADLEAKPAALRSLAGRLAADDPWAFAGPVRRVLFLGMGSSRYAAQVAARGLRRLGIDATAEYASADPAAFPPGLSEGFPAGSPAGLSAGFPAGPSASLSAGFPAGETLTVAISAGGTSRETLDAVSGDFVALTNDPGSPLAARATAVVPMHAGVEAGGVACRTFQHTQLLLHALTAHLAGLPVARTAELARRTAEATDDLLDRRDAWLPRCLDLLDGGDGIFPIAPAERISSALQSALMFREGPRRAADGCETGDWSHVDVYLTKTLRYRALFFPGSRYDAEALGWLAERGSTVVAVGAPVAGAAGTVRFRHDDDLGVRLLTETLIAELVAAAWWRLT